MKEHQKGCSQSMNTFRASKCPVIPKGSKVSTIPTTSPPLSHPSPPYNKKKRVVLSPTTLNHSQVFSYFFFYLASTEEDHKGIKESGSKTGLCDLGRVVGVFGGVSQGFCGDGEEEGHCAQEDHSKDGEDCATGCISSREHWLHDGRACCVCGCGGGREGGGRGGEGVGGWGIWVKKKKDKESPGRVKRV